MGRNGWQALGNCKWEVRDQLGKLE